MTLAATLSGLGVTNAWGTDDAGDWADLIGSSDLTLSGDAALTADGVAGDPDTVGMVTDGSGDFAVAADNVLGLELTASQTWFVYITPRIVGTGLRYFFGTQNAVGSQGWGIDSPGTNVNKIRIRVTTSTGQDLQVLTSSNYISAGVPIFICASMTGSANVTPSSVLTTVNGVIAAQGTASGALTTGTMIGNPLYASLRAGDNAGFDGDTHLAGVAPVALTAAQHLEVYNALITEPATGGGLLRFNRSTLRNHRNPAFFR